MVPLALAVWALAVSAQATDGAEVARRARERLIVRHPTVSVNDEALRLETLAAGVGVDLAPPLPDRAHPLLAERDLIQRLGLAAYLSDRVESADDAVPAPSPEIDRFLADRAEALNGIRALLVSKTLPRWALDLSKSRGVEPDPNTEGPLVLHRILLTKALLEARADRAGEAELWLEASWRLKESTAERPSLTWQLIAIAASRWQAGVLRKLRASDAGWAERMRFLPQRDRTLRAMNDDMVMGAVDFAPEELSKWSPAEFLDGMARAVESLGRTNPCAFSQVDAQGWWKSFFSGPIEKTLAGIAMPSLGKAAHKLFRLEIEGELTIRVVEARRARSSPEAPAPGTASDAESRVCSAGRWSTLAMPDGGAHVRFDGKFENWTGETGIRPPLEYTIRPVGSPPHP
jgi:hypothetical protein